ncbi:MAG: hypothetical protein V4638_12145 [Bacteroidota bacterium]
MNPAEINNKKVLLSCLNWGYGHVARCLPIIEQLCRQKNQLWIAGSPEQISIFKNYFTDLNFIVHEEYPFHFSGKGNFGTDLLKSYFALSKRIKTEQKEVEHYVKNFGIEVVISDHRYGFCTKSCLSICIVHQLNLPLKWYQAIGQKIHHRFLRQFDFLWVPDTKESKYAGILSQNRAKFNVEYIGVQSRFSFYDTQEKTIEKVVILSGPLIYAQQLLDQLVAKEESNTYYIGSKNLLHDKATHFIASDDWRACDLIILQAQHIVSRSGYSTIMDLAVLDTAFELYSTPRQAEQEYLLKRHH